MTRYLVIFTSKATGSEIYGEYPTLDEARAALDTVEIGAPVVLDGAEVGQVEGAWIEDENGSGY